MTIFVTLTKSRVTIDSQHVKYNVIIIIIITIIIIILKNKNKKETYYKLGLFFTAGAKTNDIIEKAYAS